MAGGVVARNREQHEESRDLVVRQALAVDLGLDEAGHQVLARVLLAVRGQLLGERRQRPQRFAQHFDRGAIAEGLGVGGRDEQVSGLDDALAVCLGHADHVRDRDQRQTLRDQRDEVAAAGRRHLLDDALGVGADPILDAGDLAWRERGGDEPAQLGVARCVHREEGHRCLEELGRGVGELHAVARAERLRVAGDPAHVLVANDGPVGLPALVGKTEEVLGWLVLGERALRTQPREVLVALLSGPAPEVQGSEVDLRLVCARHPLEWEAYSGDPQRPGGVGGDRRG